MNISADEVISLLGMEKHPFEGGFFAETHRSPILLTPPAGLKLSGERSLSTAIYYLLTPDTFSEMHRLKGDEVFHFYLGDPLEMLQLDPGGGGRILSIGSDLRLGQRPQVAVAGGTWQGTRLAEGGEFALMGTTMAPGYDPDDYESGDPAVLVKEYPQFKELIHALTHPAHR